MILDRRSLLKLAGSGAVYLIGSRVCFGAALAREAIAHFECSLAKRLADELPPLDGAFLFDEAACREVAVDFGHFVHKIPLGVLKPGSVSDIQKVVAYAYARQIPVVMRGTGGAAYGQTQVEQGIVIDSSTMKRMAWAGEDAIVLEPGVLWMEAIDFAIQKGKTPPVLPDTMVISVGGTLNTGGFGETSYNRGCQVDHALELQVVTGTGELLTCSETVRPDLFAAVLGGMGQVALIVSAKFRVMEAPAKVYTREYRYNGTDIDTYLADTFAFAEQEPSGAAGGHLVRNTDGKSFTFVLSLTSWGVNPPAWLGELKGKTDGTVKEWSFHQYAHRNTKSWMDSVANGSAALPHPYLSWFTPLEHTREIIEYLLSHPSATLGAAKIPLFPMLNASFTRTFPRVPNGERACHLRIYRIVRNGEAGPDHLAMIDSNQNELLPLLQSRGSTVYLPFCPLLNQEQRARQFDERTYATFSCAKRVYDPRSILTPGAGLFPSLT